MRKIAFDVALLPPGEIMGVAIAINKSYGPKFDLNKTDRLPHITLSQAIIRQQDLDKVKTRLAKIAKSFKPLKLQAKIVNSPDTFFRVTPTDQIIKLHKIVMKNLEDLVSYDAKPNYYFDDEIRERSIGWVRNFRTDAAFENFDPHISIGVQQPVEDEHPVTFLADRLALCHLGNYNTCRKILYEARLF